MTLIQVDCILMIKLILKLMSIFKAYGVEKTTGWVKTFCRTRLAGFECWLQTTAVTLVSCVVLARHLNAHVLSCEREWLWYLVSKIIVTDRWGERLIGKDPDARKDWRQKKKGTAEDEMARLHHQLNGHEFEQTLGDSGGQKSLVCCSPWGCKESDMT